MTHKLYPRERLGNILLKLTGALAEVMFLSMLVCPKYTGERKVFLSSKKPFYT